MVRDFSHVNSTEQLRSGKKFSSILFIFALSIFHVPRLFKQLTTKKRGKNVMFCKRWKHCWCWCCPTLACSSRVGDGRIMSCIVHHNNNVFCGNFSTKSAGLLFFLSFQLHKNLLKNVWKHSTPNKAKQEKIREYIFIKTNCSTARDEALMNIHRPLSTKSGVTQKSLLTLLAHSSPRPLALRLKFISV